MVISNSSYDWFYETQRLYFFLCLDQERIENLEKQLKDLQDTVGKIPTDIPAPPVIAPSDG